MEETLSEAKLRRAFNDIRRAHLDQVAAMRRFYDKAKPHARFITHVGRNEITISS